jgi:hypothetical protein
MARRTPEQARHRLIAGYFVAGLLAIATVAAIVVVATSGNGGSTAPSGDPFTPRYEGLEERRVAAGVPTMAEGGGEHFHPHLEVYVRGREITVPANIGIDPAQPPQVMAGLHTHDTSGTIHNEAGENSTLGQFFAIWGVQFSATRLGRYRAGGDEKVRLWVDGEPSEAYSDLALADGQQIVVAFGDKRDIPPRAGS